MPTEKGMRFFVDGLLEFGRVSKSDKENIKQQCSSRANLIRGVKHTSSNIRFVKLAGIVIAQNSKKT